ncbi:MFS transporter [Nocardioides marmoriginsengisoli]|uniref:MFS transporter n=1 Tax=Nocardioides marmoriginsengisoli TaxID=661483 RepID=A0A3N0CGC2_9ACTN|nr:ATP-binding protein [Nocardioides marmoriginsengisoli]RNL62510.1 MFS transporter [Nocardioides marmoriginsengisoli]
MDNETLAPPEPPSAASSLTATVLAEEADRKAAAADRSAPVLMPDDLLPGVGASSLGLRATLRRGGWVTITLAVLLVVVEQLSREATNVLGPDIQSWFGISDTKLIGLASFGGLALIMGAIPIAALADRLPRNRIVAVSGIFGALSLIGAGLAQNTFHLFLAFTLLGAATAYSNPVFGSLIADAYPIEGRGRMFSLHATATPLGLALGPFVAGTIANLAGGPEGWRWGYLALAAPLAVLALAAAFFLPEPPRGQFEQTAVLGGVMEQKVRPELPVTISIAYQRLRKVKTFYFMCMGIGALGLALITVPLQLSLLLEDEYGYGPFTRGWILSLAQIPTIVAMFVAGAAFDRIYRVTPERTVRLAGSMIIAFGVILVIGLQFHPIVLLIGFYGLACACTGGALVVINPLVASVAPYRLRGQAFAIVPVFTFLMGGFIGALGAGAVSDAYGERVALTVIVPISAIAGGLLFRYGARFLKADISRAVEEMLEERAETERMRANPDDIPALQVRNLDFSYGPVQILFDVNLDVRRGEVLALLGTNGAGKSTLLRVISGLGIPDRGVVRLHGQSLTYSEAEVRFKAGVVQLRGGAGCFGQLTVAENLRAAMLSAGLTPAERERRTERAYERFPALREAERTLAGDLSGGQQQMLALAMTLLHDPELLIIDELSLGLAPVVVQELLEVLNGLRAEGMTMIIVEQSLNLALAFADRAVFMEKGRIMFEGPADELAERDDLVRAVFLGNDRS